MRLSSDPAPAHDLDYELAWCRRCGRPMVQLIDHGPESCDGLPGTMHERYLFARDLSRLVFAKIVQVGLTRRSFAALGWQLP